MKKDVEIWKDIVGYEGLYKVSNWGRVKSLNYNHTEKERILSSWKNSDGYLQVNLCKDGKRKTHKVHRLVAEAFIPNPGNLLEVNHIDEDKTNNRVENLEFCSHKENCNWGTAIKRKVEKQSKPVVGIDPKTGKVVVEFPSTKETGRNGYNQGNVAACCRGERKTHHGLIWRYK